MARTYRLGPVRRAVDVLMKAMIGAEAGRHPVFRLTAAPAGG